MSNEKIASLLASKSEFSGRVYSSNGAMLKGAKVTCDGLETTTLADGLYILKGLSPGTYEMKVSLQGFQSISKRVSIREGEKVVLDFYLPKAVGTAKIRGHVYDESKKTVVVDGTVILVLPMANKYAHIDEDGYYEFENLPAGTYTISTSIPGYEDRDAILTVSDNEVKTYDFICKARKIEEPPWG